MCLLCIFRWCFVKLVKLLLNFCQFFCNLCTKLTCIRVFTECVHIVTKKCVMFLGGFTLGMLYYYYLLSSIPFPYDSGVILALSISVLLGVSNAVCAQLRCISLLTFPMYCGKPGRGVLKAVALTCVVAGPITNMALNAKEVVRVFACSTQLSYNLSNAKYSLVAKPFRMAVLGLRREIYEVKDTLRSFSDVIAPIEAEIESTAEIAASRKSNDYVDDLIINLHRSGGIEEKYRPNPDNQTKAIYQSYLKKLEYRCHDQLSRVIKSCMEIFAESFERCQLGVPKIVAWLLCWPMRVTHICNVVTLNTIGPEVCDSRAQINPGLEEGYVYLKKIKNNLSKNFDNIKLQYVVTSENEIFDIQDAKETGERVLHDFEEKMIIMRAVIAAVDACAALLFLRIVVAAGTYHDLYLTSIEYDNSYVTGYFKRIDRRRRDKRKPTLLPLKKMERSKYIDIHSFSWLNREHDKLFTQVLKVMLEVITATTFVMLDRLFYEALDVVRQHAEAETTPQGIQDLGIEVEGTGVLARIIRKMLNSPNSEAHSHRSYTTKPCLPRPRLMPVTYFINIYGGYLWILLLLYLNPYTVRLRRLISSHFYPRREKQRILHLYNDILKKRLKMQKTLRRKAVQAVRAHYLSGESLLSLRMRFPELLGWLKVFSEARMACLICGETEPRNRCDLPPESAWHSCPATRCPFVYCPECWVEVGERCLACDPSLAELSDVDSLSEDELPTY